MGEPASSSTGSRLSRSPFVEPSLTGTSVCFSKPARHSLKPSCAIAKAFAVGEDPDWNDDDYIVLGLAHCFQKDDDGKLKDALIVEPVTAGTFECMENVGRAPNGRIQPALHLSYKPAAP